MEPVHNQAAAGSSRRLRGKSCFTLVETLVASAIAGVAIAAAMSLVSLYMWVDYIMDYRNAAVSVARSRCEYLRTVTFANLPYGVESNVRVDANGTSADDGNLLRSTTIAMDSSNTYATVTVTIQIASKVGFPAQQMSTTTCLMDKSLVTNLQ